MERGRSRIYACLGAAFLSACGGAGGKLPAVTAAARPPVAVPSRLQGASSRYRLLHNFGKGFDGANPFVGGLLDVGGTLYGTTSNGGAYGKGTVFSISTAGKEQVLHSFGSGVDGANPSAGLLDVNGVLYGTTGGGGAFTSSGSGRGTVFAISTTGKEKVLHSFGKGTDGQAPVAGLIDVNGTLYGTTNAGGKDGWGTVFSVSTSGKERVLHSFAGESDGREPYAGLVDVNGTLYGTTYYGPYFSYGMVFSISTAGTEKVIYAFDSPDAGAFPWATLIIVNGTLYGTTLGGGMYGGGIVFGVSTAGKERILHSFGKPATYDGLYPIGGLIHVNGTFYGTTSCGGRYDSSKCDGYSGPAPGGTIFSLTSSGEEHVLYNFGKESTDGAQPDESLVDVQNVLYGVTDYGGAYDGSGGGAGTIFTWAL
jgi:uncharacterized repeat protein (TIGR03803 family)